MLINLNNLKTFYNALIQKIKGFRGNWNQNDPAADDYIKNRPFYSEDSEIIIFNNAASSDSFTLSEPLAEGVTYTVIFNGTTYQCLAKNYDGYIMIGNNAIYEFDNNITTDTGEPFAIECPAGNPIAYPYYNDSVTEAPSITISYMGELVHKLDKKYIDIPDGIVTENNLATVATSGSYDDLNNKPTIYTDVVRYGSSQSLTTAQKSVARSNIGAGTSSFSGSYDDLTNKPTIYDDIVRYSSQSLTEDQKSMARVNINVYSKEETYSDTEASRTITWDGDITDKDSFSFVFSTDIYYKVSELLFDANNVVSVSCTGTFQSESYSTDGVRIIDGVIVANSSGEHKIYLDEAETTSVTITVPSAGIYFYKTADYLYVNSAVITYKARSIPSDVVGVVRTINGEAPDIDGNVDIIISSSTEGSTKKFKLTVDDSGTLTTTELT